MKNSTTRSANFPAASELLVSPHFGGLSGARTQPDASLWSCCDVASEPEQILRHHLP